VADHYYGLNIGHGLNPVQAIRTGTSSTATDDIELRTLDGEGLTRMDVIKALRCYLAYFEQNNAPTA
jgi:hypothetical protein